MPHLTDYHAKYLAYELIKRYSSDSAQKLGEAVASAIDWKRVTQVSIIIYR